MKTCIWNFKGGRELYSYVSSTNIYCIPTICQALLALEDTAGNKADQISALTQLTFESGEADNEQLSK